MFDTVVIATDGSGSARRAVEAALDLAARFDATVHALYVVDEHEVETTPEEVREALERALATTGGRALSFVVEAAEDESDEELVTAVRQGTRRPRSSRTPRSTTRTSWPPGPGAATASTRSCWGASPSRSSAGRRCPSSLSASSRANQTPSARGRRDPTDSCRCRCLQAHG